MRVSDAHTIASMLTFCFPLSPLFSSSLLSADHSIWKSLLLRLPSLEYFNLLPIDHASRLAAYRYTKSKKLYPIVAATIWNQAVNSSPQVVQMQASGSGWNPKGVIELHLQNHSLLSFSTMSLRLSLKVLNLASNQITTLIGTGLHMCKELRSLNLANNLLSNLDELYLLGHLPLLRQLWLQGNNQLENYQSTVIYATRHLRGRNRTPGLQELDALPVTLEQRVQAYEKIAMNGKVQSQRERWRLMLIQQYGHRQLIEIPQKFTKLAISGKPELLYADVSAFTGLLSLDLSGCKLKTIEGLELLTKLKYIDVRFNPELNTKLVIAQLQQLGASLVWASLARSEEEMNDFTGLRMKFLSALLGQCPYLRVLDHRDILVQEYVQVFTKSRGIEKDHPMRFDYVLGLSLVMHNTPTEGRRYDAEHCIPGQIVEKSQVLFENVTTLSMPGLKLTDAFIMPNLPNLTLLNVSSNKFTKLDPFHLDRCPELLFLDVRHNKLKYTPADIATALGSCPKLYGFAMAGNPGYTAKYRSKLIGCIPELASLDCVLKILDEPVTVDERVVAWGAESHMLTGGAIEEQEDDNQEEQDQIGPLSPKSPANALASPSAGSSTLQVPNSPSNNTNVAPGSTKQSPVKGLHQHRPSVFQAALPDAKLNPRLYNLTLKKNKASGESHRVGVQLVAFRLMADFLAPFLFSHSSRKRRIFTSSRR
jgi:Leucine-rich repeat (LRR) protein